MKTVAVRRLAAGADAALALLVVAVVTLMIVPLPTWLLDVLLAANLSASVAILLVVLYVPDAVSVAAFPTLLLLTTLFRLALNVSTTRLILLQANAGRVIRAFGDFVVRGNYVVGGVVFLILTIIQYVVVVRGAERVAEVGARFVLDALPGKQMAIDAELRSAQIDMAEARRRRRTLARESHFYGAMDGAMKFVKGDVIATLVILVVNLVGGLAIGVAQRGMPLGDALKRYGLLTIGDGLVTQIPALLLSTAAGVLVTRTASEEPDTPLGRELARQLLGQPRALGVAAGFIGLMALVPGFPALPFLVMGVGLAFGARARAAYLARADAEADMPSSEVARARRGLQFVPMLEPWSLVVSADLERLVPELRTRASAIRAAVFAELGVPLPAARVRVDARFPPRSVEVALQEVPTPLLQVPGSEADVLSWVEGEALGLLRARAHEFLGLAETQRLLDELEAIAPAAVRGVVPRPVPLPLLADVLRRLVEEQVSVRDFATVLEALATLAPHEKDPLALAEHVRAQLRRALTFRVTHGAPSLRVVLLDTMVEETVRRGITRTPQGAYLALAPEPARDLIAAIKRAAAQATDRPRVLLTQPDVRRYVRKLIETELPDVVVMSYAELLPEIAVRPVATANLAGIG